ncbi:DUF2777 family protein [Bacillus sp. FJAT-45350]|uniref:DUF2777 family protein n=1 Tax=Bacillus sp. FJAT-45350 TaxID=2011014 RepID=UPI000BB8C854|nr:DUF2777 family protein [Bacillus sp. FJAT-45350]
MNRKQAHTLIGSYVLIDEQTEGQYIGTLLQVIAEPRKPWKGIVKVASIHTLPLQELSPDGEFTLQEPLYKENEEIEVTGSKVMFFEDEVETYQESLITSLTKEIDIQKDQLKILSSLLTYLQMLDPEKAEEYQRFFTSDDDPEIKDTNYVYYLLNEVKNQVMLYDEDQEQYLALEGCPFEFELYYEKQWRKCHYISGMEFQLENDEVIELSPDVMLRLEKQQFEPYHLLINELEKPALESLEKSLQSFKVSHDDVVHCQNSLLLQLLHSTESKQFKGVNFITFQTKQQTVVVQHHYERTLSENDNDDVYDRFEFTTDKGQRSIVTYTNEFSTRDKN